MFDETLKQALALGLGQSPFLNILSDRKMMATLRLMGRSPEQPVTGEVARDRFAQLTAHLIGGIAEATTSLARSTESPQRGAQSHVRER